MTQVIVVVVHQGAADVVRSTVPKGVDVDVVDIDTLKELGEGDIPPLTREGWEYLKIDWPELAKKFAYYFDTKVKGE